MRAPKQLGKLMAATGVALALSAGSLFAVEHGAHQHAQAAAPATLTLNDGRKWGTDEALRQGMENIRAAMDASMPQIHAGKLPDAGYATLAGKLNAELGGIIANCKLEAKADAQLHLVIAELTEAIEAMEGKNRKVKRRSGALKVLGALELYGRHFDHPDWQAIMH